MIAEQLSAVNQLSIEEKWMLANELWNEVEEHQDELKNSPEIAALVEKRFADHDRDPSPAMTLEEFKCRFKLP